MTDKKLTGTQRLAIFLAGGWIILVGIVSALGFGFNWALFLGVGVFPVGFIWGIVWVIAGFRKREEH